jgi:hypothetical protein
VDIQRTGRHRGGVEAGDLGAANSRACQVGNLRRVEIAATDQHDPMLRHRRNPSPVAISLGGEHTSSRSGMPPS